MKRIALLVSVSLAFLLATSAAIAQYPQPTGNLTLTASSTVSTTGADVLLACLLKDSAGNPNAGAPCTFTVVSGDAEVGSKVVTKTTNASGTATTILKIGSTPGQIVVTASSGNFQSTIVVSVASGAGAPPAAPISPPSTGDGGLAK